MTNNQAYAMPAEQTHNPPIPFHLIIAAAGSGTRFDETLPKQFWPLHGKTILRRTVERFLGIKGLQSITLVINPAHDRYTEPSLKTLDFVHIIDGGETRKQSIYNALKSFSELKNKDIILIHDAARPFVETDEIEAILKSLQNSKAATLCTHVTDTLHDTKTHSYPNRDTLRAIQTPQGFHYGTILAAHEQAKDAENFTDDTSLVMAMGETVDFIDASPQNIKITTKADFLMAEQRLASQMITRTGLGFDVHAFDDERPASVVRLGGINIPHNRALKGHSDADVVLHTITDALLGAMALGDIGDHFPPSDHAYKDMDSMIFLKKAQELITERGAQVVNIDLTIMAEEPKIGAYKVQMQRHIETALGLHAGTISIKATTTEKLGFTGRKEGIAAQAIATINAPK
jgi:2-C-methyl-D-erythritol 4-phosphate cytidylyltransferase / 2-C-methyl-D-erythritol 2,4-cyclodiphosphate synthase